jgi:cytoskeletal protein RodZ
MSESPGTKLRRKREEQELTIEQISEALHIRIKYLKAIEADNLDAIPSLPQARGFLRSYASFLGISPQNVVSETKKQAEKTSAPPEALAEEPSNSSSDHLIFKEIGASLFKRREILGLSMEDVEAHTRIPTYYVEYMESGEFSSFPSPAQARGMLNNYVQFLDLDTDAIMARYAHALQTSLSERQALEIPRTQDQTNRRQRKRQIRAPQWVRMFLSPDLILITTVGIIVIGLTIWGIGRIVRTQDQQSPIPTAPSLVEALLPTATTEPTQTSASDQGGSEGELLGIDNPEIEDTPIPTVPVAGGSSIQVFMIVRQRTYLQVTVDGTVAYDGRTAPSNNLTFTGQEEIRVITGNAAAIQLFYNDQDLGVLGIFGEIVEIIFTREGVIRPTKVPTPTLLATETPTATPEPTDTPSGGNLPPEPNTPVP